MARLHFVRELEHDGATEAGAILRCQARRQLPSGTPEITIGRSLPVGTSKILRIGGSDGARNHWNSVLHRNRHRQKFSDNVPEAHVHRADRQGGYHQHRF